ncbi:MAG: carbohydrate binding family 9 domain-containing protein, partial [Psychrosphaera sp.]|nr:carbohydrate binding family 9 domain-containing protein [Psychrosphaera sp.]
MDWFVNKWAKQAFIFGLLRGAAIMALLFSTRVLADAPTINIPRIANADITVDAKLSEPMWDKAVVVNMSNITFPEENHPASVKTTAYLFEDGETLYIGFKAQDPDPAKIRAFLRDRDSNNIFNDDMIGIKLDTYGDHKLAYQFWVNALGVQVDSIENAVTGRESSAWDAIWDSAGQITDDGYVVEMALPLRILNFNDQLDKQYWAVELVRFYPRENRQRISNMTIDPNNDCMVCQMGPLHGFAGAKQGKNLAIVPSLTVGASETRDISATPVTDWERDTNADIGLDLKWGITPDISLNATFNPDFSQIEADAGQLSINNTF